MKVFLHLIAAFVALDLPAQTPEYGPEKGTLVLVGGLQGAVGLLETFVSLAGGLDAKIVVIPAGSAVAAAKGKPRVYKADVVLAPWKKLGLTNVHMLYAAEPKDADTEEFVRTLGDARGVWFGGGSQEQLADSFAHSRSLMEFHKVLARGGVIGGTSAGAMVQGDQLLRSTPGSGPGNSPPDPQRWRGFGFLRKTVIDPHVNGRNTWDDLVPVIRKYPEVLGLGISNGTAIVVTGDRFQIIGNWKVAVHDNTRVYPPWEKPYYVLSPGDVYNMKTRKIEEYGTGALQPATIKVP